MDEQELLDQIETYLTVSGLSPSAFGNKALNDPRFVFDLRNGERELRRKTRERVESFMRENPAQGAA